MSLFNRNNYNPSTIKVSFTQLLPLFLTFLDLPPTPSLAKQVYNRPPLQPPLSSVVIITKLSIADHRRNRNDVGASIRQWLRLDLAVGASIWPWEAPNLVMPLAKSAFQWPNLVSVNVRSTFQRLDLAATRTRLALQCR
ncbi:Uncharacterized protein TCM_019216 [Theobroma cacao]|uniref:Uncharacterized protein n=1 Tax=Theobroma cacao TaxID=3641 RepID=A0A061ENS4_THECC|nr:Uncharacterized protein TCM_019216 [Theobroma cacao]